MNYWKLFDELIDGIAPDALAEEIICGATHSAVRSGGSVGISSAFDQTWRQPIMPQKVPGITLRELAECVKSWDFAEASVGLAAINAWYNDRERVRALGLSLPELRHVEDRSADPFIMMQREVAGKKATVIGHFPYIDQLFAPVCDLRVIEKFNPQDGDYPEQAADYLLPESDFVFISSYTFVEKSLPRFLELSQNAYVTLVGPATTVATALFTYGVDALAGFVVKDSDAAMDIALGHGGNMHAVGQKVNLLRQSAKG
jgi:uncharacterized protein (DUF4213/DUF364 family)